MPELLVSLFQAVVRASVQASVVILVVLMVRWLVRFRFSGPWLYALWLPVLLRLLLPISFPQSSVSLYNAAAPVVPRQAMPFAEMLAPGPLRTLPAAETVLPPPWSARNEPTVLLERKLARMM